MTDERAATMTAMTTDQPREGSTEEGDLFHFANL
jgi:hypothetical protein